MSEYGQHAIAAPETQAKVDGGAKLLRRGMCVAAMLARIEIAVERNRNGVDGPVEGMPDKFTVGVHAVDRSVWSDEVVVSASLSRFRA